MLAVLPHSKKSTRGVLTSALAAPAAPLSDPVARCGASCPLHLHVSARPLPWSFPSAKVFVYFPGLLPAYVEGGPADK